ncbi:hypothetical protein K438DRAFT_359045 [Mycena galopus ATCC 62051]|nr:hypothetical protein K438DRAFT_359045 [Mycena galopus ATCC 62051]
MVWPAFDEDDAPVVNEEAPVMGIDTHGSGSSKNELKNDAPIKEEDSKELRINAHTSNKMGSIEGEEELTFSR